MKNLIIALPLVLLLSSCVMTKTYTKEELKMKTDNGDVFVIKNDGKKISGTTLKLSYKPPSIKIDDQEISTKELIAYQDKNAFFLKYKTGDNFIWAKQLKRGKINLYYFDVATRTTVFNGTKYVTDHVINSHFVFNKGNEELLELNISGIAKLLKNNKNAFNKFTSTFGEKNRIILPKQLQAHPKVLFDAIDIYNGDL